MPTAASQTSPPSTTLDDGIIEEPEPLLHADGVAECGNGVIEEGETCDDGNTRHDDGCTSACWVGLGYVCPQPGEPCRFERCGDGFLTRTEECDDGNDVRDDGCWDCTVQRFWTCPATGGPCTMLFPCGDGLIGGPEQCDDGNDDDGDGCSSECQLESGWICGAAGRPCRAQRMDAGQSDAGVGEDAGAALAASCGDGIPSGAEECDDGDANGPGYGACTEQCTLGPYCGDGSVDVENGEQCDNGTNLDVFIVDDSSCAPGCRVPTCGDGVVQVETEECDLGRDPVTGALLNDNRYDGCRPDCALSDSRCGNGALDGDEGEECDDGGRRSGDGCSSNCRSERPRGDGPTGLKPIYP